MNDYSNLKDNPKYNYYYADTKHTYQPEEDDFSEWKQAIHEQKWFIDDNEYDFEISDKYAGGRK